MHVLGIDAGGTKTVCLLADAEGRVLADARGGGANLQAAGELDVEKVLHQVMDDVLSAHDVRPAAICLGMAGVDRAGDAAAVGGIMRRICARTRVVVVNDALIALVAGAGDGAGVVVVAGTGSIAYGRDGAGRIARAGGWGYLLGDEGGGFWLGRSALAAVVRQFDGRGPATRLTDLVVDHLRLESPTALVHAVYHREVPRQTIASLAPLVERARVDGDAVAADIMARAVDELAAAAGTVITRLDMRGETFPIVLAGGVLRSVQWLADEVSRRLVEIAPRAASVRLQVEPAIGAVHLARAAAMGSGALPSWASAGG